MNKKKLTVFENNCEKCYEPYLFELEKDGKIVTLGLSTLLECLSFAEEEDAVPRLPAEWWIELQKFIFVFLPL